MDKWGIQMVVCLGKRLYGIGLYPLDWRVGHQSISTPLLVELFYFGPFVFTVSLSSLDKDIKIE